MDKLHVCYFSSICPLLEFFDKICCSKVDVVGILLALSLIFSLPFVPLLPTSSKSDFSQSRNIFSACYFSLRREVTVQNPSTHKIFSSFLLHLKYFFDMKIGQFSEHNKWLLTLTKSHFCDEHLLKMYMVNLSWRFRTFNILLQKVEKATLSFIVIHRHTLFQTLSCRWGIASTLWKLADHFKLINIDYVMELCLLTFMVIFRFWIKRSSMSYLPQMSNCHSRQHIAFSTLVVSIRG